MLKFTKTAAVLLTLSFSIAATVNAEEVSLETLVSNMLAQSVATAQQELNNNIQGAVLTAANEFNIVEEEAYATKTTITDLHSEIEVTAKTLAE